MYQIRINRRKKGRTDTSKKRETRSEFEKLADRHTGRKIRVLRSDGGGEYLHGFLQGHFEKAGIRHDLTVAYSPHHDGVAERINRTLVGPFRSMIHGKGLSKDLPAEALATAVYIRNRMTRRTRITVIQMDHLQEKSSPNVIMEKHLNRKLMMVMNKKMNRMKYWTLQPSVQLMIVSIKF